MADVHLFGDVGGGEVDDDLLLWYLGEVEALDEFVDLGLDELVLYSNLQKAFFVCFDWTDNIVFKVVIHYFFSEFDDVFASKWSAFFFVFVHVKLFHGIWWDVFTFVFRSILNGNIAFGSWEGFKDEILESFFDESWDEFGLGLHYDKLIVLLLWVFIISP